MSAPYTNKPKLNHDGSIPAEFFDEDYWEHGDASGRGSYNGNEYSDNLDLCKYWATDVYKRWGPFKTYLEIGCGKGWNIWGYLHLPELGIEPQGVDISHYALTTTVEEVKPYIIEHDASDLSFIDSDSKDIIFSNDFLEHLAGFQIDRCLEECKRIAKRKVVHLISIGDGHDFNEVPSDQDQSHISLHSIDWWKEKLEQHFQPDWGIEMLQRDRTIDVTLTRRGD